MKVRLHAFFILALDGSEWSTSCFTYFVPKKSPTHWTGFCMMHETWYVGEDKRIYTSSRYCTDLASLLN
jgi:hypothetical protein